VLSRELVITEPGQISLVDVELSADLQPHEVLVRAAHSIVSPGTETALFSGLAARMPHIGRDQHYPTWTGYGHVGEVLAIGDRVTACSPGDTVLSFSHHASLVKASSSVMATPTRVPRPPMTLPIPDGLTSRAAVFARMAGVSIAAVRASSVHPGDKVLVIGLGIVGNLAAQLFSLAGAEVLACDLSAFRRNIAVRCGIERVVGANELEDAVAEWTQGRGARVVVEGTGVASVTEQAVACCAMHGEVILLGSPRAPAVMDVTPLLLRVHLQAIKLIGALEWTWPLEQAPMGLASIVENHRQILGWISDGKLVAGPLLTDLASPRDCQRIYQVLNESKDQHVAAVFDWSLV
jgi:2-desacetyl-2-hydroxyethyl bacteriochlorophyllide A dehydrogenase